MMFGRTFNLLSAREIRGFKWHSGSFGKHSVINLQSPKCVVHSHKCQSTLPSDDELVNIFQSHQPSSKPENELPPKVLEPDLRIPERQKKKDVIISCLRSELNHYRNQTYDKFKPIPLASKGWNHYKSKGDYFKILISNEASYIDSLFWEAETKRFEDLKLSEGVVGALGGLGVEKPTKIQENAIPTLLRSKNAIISAETGCGKTLAYLLPVIEQVIKWNKQAQNRPPNSPLALILCPSRDLAEQIGRVAKTLSHQLPFSCHVVTGGRTKRKMLNPDFAYVDLIVATLGAMSKLTTVGIYNLSEIKHVVLDEADSLLDDSFNDLMRRFLGKIKIQHHPAHKDGLPQFAQLTLVSATTPRDMYNILEGIVEPDSLTTITTERLHKVLNHVPQTFYRLGGSQKPEKLLQIAHEAKKRKEPLMIFSNRSKTCDWISLTLNENGIETAHLNGDMPQIMRRGIFQSFQQGDVNVLSATDIASRGLDTVRVKHVLNFDFPLFMADYIHRCGRTGRVGSPHNCRISNFVCGEREVELVQKIELAVRTMEALPNVNANINRLIRARIMKSLKSEGQQ